MDREAVHNETKFQRSYSWQKSNPKIRAILQTALPQFVLLFLKMHLEIKS